MMIVHVTVVVHVDGPYIIYQMHDLHVTVTTSDAKKTRFFCSFFCKKKQFFFLLLFFF